MSYKDLKEKFLKIGVLNIKLFNKEYRIESQDDYVVIYPIGEKSRIKKFQSFDELMKNYAIYMEPLKEHIYDISVL